MRAEERLISRVCHSGLAGLALCALTVQPVLAQDSITISEVNLPYMHYFGFGAFRAGEAESWALSGSWTPTMRDHAGRRFGWAGRFTGKLMGVRAESTPSEFETALIAGMTLGVEFRFPVSEYSLIRVFTDWGVAVDVEKDGEAGLGALGATGEIVWPWRGFELGVQPGVDLAASATSTSHIDDSLLAVQVRLDARHYLGFDIAGRGAQGGLYLDLASFAGDTGLDPSGNATAFADNQLELGCTFGTHDKIRILGWGPLLNVGFRWGHNFHGIRIGLSDRLTRLPARP